MDPVKANRELSRVHEPHVPASSMGPISKPRRCPVPVGYKLVSALGLGCMGMSWSYGPAKDKQAMALECVEQPA